MISWRALGGLLSETDTIVRSNVDRGSFLFWFCHRGGGDENCDDGDDDDEAGDGDGDGRHSIIDTKRWQSPPPNAGALAGLI